MILTLADMEGNETFDASMLGTADEVCCSGHLRHLEPHTASKKVLDVTAHAAVLGSWQGTDEHMGTSVLLRLGSKECVPAIRHFCEQSCLLRPFPAGC